MNISQIKNINTAISDIRSEICLTYMDTKNQCDFVVLSVL